MGAGISIIARGEWQVHPKFGKQFRAWSITETLPTSEEAIASYLGSGAVKGFGPVLAKRVVDAFGIDTLKILDDDINRLTEVPGIGEKKLQEITAAWKEKQALREVLLFFQTHNISLTLAQKIYSAYGERAIERVKSNPYILSRDIWGIGFQTADKIAAALGTQADAPERIRAGLDHILKRAADDGHCFLPQDELISKSSSLLQLDNHETISGELCYMTLEGELIAENDKVYSTQLHLAETELAHEIAARVNKNARPNHPIPSSLTANVANTQSVVGEGRWQKTISLSEQQKEAVQLAADRSLLVVTGGPGCGKTTVVQTIVSLFRQAGLSVKLAAPTGRAAQRLAEVCATEASTIHRLLRFEPGSRTFLHDQDSPLSAEAIIIDEASMIDLPLAASLFKAIPKGARVVIVGDADQLPSVGPGRVLGDLLNIPEVPRVCLTTLFRRAEESSITHIAHQINSAAVPHIPQPDGNTRSDSYFLPSQDVTEAADLVERLVVDQIPKKFGISGSDITVLSPMNNGELGIIALNKRLQERLVPPRPELPQVAIGNSIFRLGDRVIQRSNNYNLTDNGVFNGDQGSIIGIDTVNETINVRLWDGREVEYPSNVIHQLDLAYAITIHRAQGTEVPAVVLALHDSHHILLERQLVYTAITRAKKLLVIVGTKRALITAVKRTRGSKRYTELVNRSREILT
jgi:exodeoxyribonuclease V alpha subunit